MIEPVFQLARVFELISRSTGRVLADMGLQNAAENGRYSLWVSTLFAN